MFAACPADAACISVLETCSGIGPTGIPQILQEQKLSLLGSHGDGKTNVERLPADGKDHA